jgi:hypothetical protein
MLPICVFAIGTYASWSCEHIKQKNEYKPEDKKQTNKTVKDENDSKKNLNKSFFFNFNFLPTCLLPKIKMIR